ncbi:MAG: aspartate kinase [Bacteroidales bacterium]|nr:aspartate kinase [Bacteroidales bacterium]
MIVLKFGGSSVENATAMSRVLDIVESAASRDRVVLVCSAIKGCTDALIEIGRVEDPERQLNDLLNRHIAIIRRLFTGPDREQAIVDCKTIFSEIRCIPAVIEQFGEILSTRILARKLHTEGFKTTWLDSRDLVRTLPGSTEADTKATYKAISEAIEKDAVARIFVAPGFIARDPNGAPTTLGRGGSDYSASLYAAALGAQDLEIWTDVPGIMTANPRDVPAARSIPAISYGAAFDMARYGAKVLYAPAVAPAREAGIAIGIRNTFDPSHPGTVIAAQDEPGCKGVASMETAPGITTIALVCHQTGADATIRRIGTALREIGVRPLSEPVPDEQGNILVTVRTLVARSCVAALHREFFEARALSSLDVYVAGAGAVGRALQGIVKERDGQFPAAGKRINLLEISSNHDFADHVLQTARSRSVFVDCTNSKDIWRKFVPLLNAGINIVSSNRRSLAIPYADYAAIKAAAAESGCFFRYNTTVGNALPILQSISGGEEVTAIEAVVSCTLNLVITSYKGDGSESFADILRRAQREGLTEADPRTDLAGRDALRKLLILAREAGVPLEASEVEIHPMLPTEFFEGSLDDFYAKLDAYEGELARQETFLHEHGLRRRFVASLQREIPGQAGNDGKTAWNEGDAAGNDGPKACGYRAVIEMREVGIESPYYWIDGTENVTVIHSVDSYPLVIKGSGEGVRLAAAGIIKDILL